MRSYPTVGISWRAIRRLVLSNSWMNSRRLPPAKFNEALFANADLPARGDHLCFRAIVLIPDYACREPWASCLDSVNHDYPGIRRLVPDLLDGGVVVRLVKLLRSLQIGKFDDCHARPLALQS